MSTKRIMAFELEHYSNSAFKPKLALNQIPSMSKEVINITTDLLEIAEEFKTLTTYYMKSSDFLYQCRDIITATINLSELLRTFLTELLDDTMERINTIDKNSKDFTEDIAAVAESLTKSLSAIDSLKGINDNFAKSNAKFLETLPANPNGQTSTIVVPSPNQANFDAASVSSQEGIYPNAKKGEPWYRDNTINAPYFSQNDPRWAGKQSKNDQMFGDFGCGYSSLAALTSAESGKLVTPIEMFEYLSATKDTDKDGKYDSFIDFNNDGVENEKDPISYRSDGKDAMKLESLYDSRFQEKYGVVANQIHISDGDKSINDGVGIILTSGPHYISVVPSTETYVKPNGEVQRKSVVYDSYHPENNLIVDSVEDAAALLTDRGQAHQIMSPEKAASIDYSKYRVITDGFWKVDTFK